MLRVDPGMRKIKKEDEKMAGMLLHLAMGDPEKLDADHSEYSVSYHRAYALGLLLPDIAKQGLISGPDDFNRYFEGCSPADIPTWEEYLRFCRTHHFNPDPRNPAQQDTRDPKLDEFLRAGFVDLNKPVWQGVFCHLMGDKAFYYGAYCVDDARAMEDYRREVGEIEPWDPAKWRGSRTGRTYYEDYDVLNRCVEEEFGVLRRVSRYLSPALLEELLAAFHVAFSADRAEPLYMNLANIKKYLAFSRDLSRRKAENPEDIPAFFTPQNLDAIFRSNHTLLQ